MRMACLSDRLRTDASAYNLYGLLLERQQLYRSAAGAFRAALQLLTAEKQDDKFRQVSLNLARVLV